MPFAAIWMDPKIITLSEVRKRKTNVIRQNLCVESKREREINLFSKQKQILWLPKGKEGRRINWEFGINRYTLRYVKQITNKDLLYSTGNSTRYSNSLKDNAAAAAESLQSCPTLCDPIGGSPAGSPVPGIL